jgi:tetratricopeptide (TPR) repeat protein
MSSVYRVHDRRLDRTVALKMLHPHITENRSSVERFLREAQAEGQIAHINVINVRSVCADPSGQLYIIMDYLEGDSLAERINDRATLSEPQIFGIFLQICRGLEAAHDKGIIHRDLKPSNIMLIGERKQPVVKIVDFGIAKLVGDRPKEQQLTKAGSILGSPAYMSPEQCDAKPLDGRSDIYSLGCLMYEVLTGKTPFEAESDLEVMCKHVYDMPEPIVQLAPQFARFDPIIFRCLQKNPDDRYQHICELRAALEGLRQGVEPEPVAMSSTRRRSAPAITGKQPKWGLAAALSLLLLGGVVGGVAMMAPPAKPDETRALQDEIAAAESENNVPRLLVAALKLSDLQINNEVHTNEAVKRYNRVLRQLALSPQLAPDKEIASLVPHAVAQADPSSLDVLITLSDNYLAVGDSRSARVLSEAALRHAEAAQNSLMQANALLQLAHVNVIQGREDLSWSTAQKAMDLYAQFGRPNTATFFRISDLGKRFADVRKDYRKAAQVHARGYQMAEHQGMNAATLGAFAFDCANAYTHAFDYKAAHPWYEKAVAARERFLKPTDVMMALTLFETGYALQMQGQHAHAKRYYDRCRPGIELMLADGTLGSESMRVVNNMADVYQSTGHNQIADSLRSKVQ